MYSENKKSEGRSGKHALATFGADTENLSSPLIQSVSVEAPRLQGMFATGAPRIFKFSENIYCLHLFNASVILSKMFSRPSVSAIPVFSSRIYGCV